MASRHVKKISVKAGTAPGTLVHIGEKKIETIRLTVTKYDVHNFEERRCNTLDEALAHCDGPGLAWFNVDGIHDTDMMARIGRHFNIHPLTLEDILNTAQRPKVDTFESYLYIVLKMLRYLPQSGQVASEQISLILTPQALISFQESEGDVFASVRERLHKEGGRIRKAGCDYLAYALVDAIVDHYFVILEHLSIEIEMLEEDMLRAPNAAALQRIHDLKHETIFLRKQVWPLREVIGGLTKNDAGFIHTATTVFLRDVHDHTIQVVETIESYRDVLSGLLDLYLSTVSNKMNEVMKVLTIIATIFIPITFLVGVYGMNFKHMPELQWRWGYGMLWGVMGVVVAVMILYFKRKKWL